MSLLANLPSTRVRSQIRPALGAPVRHRLRMHVHEYELPLGETCVGREAGCRILIEDATISRRHAEITVDLARVTLRDLGSRNGTFVNGERLAEGEVVELHDGDRLKLGRIDVQFVACIPRAPMRSTLRLRACGGCGASFAFDIKACPSCGAEADDGDWMLREGVIRTPVDDGARKNWWLQLHVDLVERALTLWRLDDAQRALQRIEDGLTSRARDTIDDATLDRAFDVAIRLAAAQGDAAWMRWTLQTHVARERVPSRPIVDRLRALPPILLEGTRDALETLTSRLASTGDADSEERLAVLRAIRIELDRWRARADDVLTDRVTSA